MVNILVEGFHYASSSKSRLCYQLIIKAIVCAKIYKNEVVPNSIQYITGNIWMCYIFHDDYNPFALIKH